MPSPTPSKPSPPTWDEQIIQRILPYRRELAGLGLFLLTAVTLLALMGVTSALWLTPWTAYLNQLFGWGAYSLCFSFAALGIHWMLRRVERPYTILASQIIGLELILLTALPLTYQFSSGTFNTAYLGQNGGLVGWALAAPLLTFLGGWFTGLWYTAFLVWGALLLTRRTWQDLIDLLRATSALFQEWAQKLYPGIATQPPINTFRRATAVALPQSNLPAQPPEDPSKNPNPRRDKRLPPFAVLEQGTPLSLPPEEVARKKKIIEQTLFDFGIPATVISVQQGPAVTQFGVQPGYVDRPGPDGTVKQFKIRVNQIAALQRDLTLALAAPRIRIQAPVPGRGVVGVEVPNAEIGMVRMRTIMEANAFRKLSSPLAVALGQDVAGAPVAIDLARMPHLLIAGTTGSGKSVCMNALISCLVFNNLPESLHLVMIDPKKVELIRFNGLPHMIGKVEVEADRAVGVLRWLTAEMDRRYELFSKVAVRNIAGYNQQVAKDPKSPKLPYIAVFIDELADLMHTYPGDVERTLCRLAQMARATGIHLVVATQRPSTDVITGLIKANFPARISFSVASGIDSRVILDSVGAENLLGKGDMLFLTPDASAPARTQGVYLSDHEIEEIVAHWQKTMPDHKPTPCPWETLIAKHALIEETDSLLEAAIELAQKYDNLSSSFLQRRLRLGYPRAARLMEQLHEMGFVEDPKGAGKTRRSLVDGDDEDPLGSYLSDH